MTSSGHLRRRATALAAAVGLLVASLAIVVDAQACSSEAQERMQACLDQIERDEAQLPTGFCTSTNWTCICTKQQGMGDCYSGCPSLIPADQVSFDKDNCAGQHEGVQMNDLGGSLMYTWSDLNIPLSGSTVENAPDSTASSTNSSSNDNGKSSAGVNGTSNAASSTPSDSPPPTATGSNPTRSPSSATAIRHESDAWLWAALSATGLGLALTV